jgi:hypothetical protein
MHRWLKRSLVAALLLAATLAMPEAQASSGQAGLADAHKATVNKATVNKATENEDRDEQRRNSDGLDAARKATKKFHDVEKAPRAGYGRLLNCFDQPGVGGMGQHYVNTGLFNDKVAVSQPEALVYEVDGARLKLVAIEYIIPQSAWTSSEPPTLLGHSFFRNDALGLWALHAWIWRNNPLGMFANYNPKVKLCPGH